MTKRSMTSPRTTAQPAVATTGSRSAPRLVQVNDRLWRVTRQTGEILGYVESFDSPAGDRYRAKRYILRARRFDVLGEFWRIDDATDALRFG
ncbi:hypothetical protein ACFFGH_11270 [Lysobacter korlensis]|uniref:Uncharacterized protein n=1 Tax=Lysobacter korlensis TaxID=553636 RepID=A0ABV6RN59_9GAMM